MHPIIREMQVIGQEAQLLTVIDNHQLYVQYKDVVFQRLLDAAYILFLNDATQILNAILASRLHDNYRTLTMLSMQLYQNHFDIVTMTFDKKEMSEFYRFLKPIKLINLIDSNVDDTRDLINKFVKTPIYLSNEFIPNSKEIWPQNKWLLFLSKLAYMTIMES